MSENTTVETAEASEQPQVTPRGCRGGAARAHGGTRVPHHHLTAPA